MLTLVAALAVARAIKDVTQEEAMIKWPNDIQIKGKKISGILAEGVIENGKLEGLVLGFGVFKKSIFRIF